MKSRWRRIATYVGVATCLGTGSLSAQDASVPTKVAESFLGRWSATVDGPDGFIHLQFDLADDGGQVAGLVWTPDGTMKLIEEIMMTGPELMLSYRMDVGAAGFRVVLYLLPEGEHMSITLNAGGGMFIGKGKGVRR